jgi:hypothetical protein
MRIRRPRSRIATTARGQLALARQESGRRLVGLADHARRRRRPYRAAQKLVLDEERFSSTTMISSRPSAKRRAPIGLQRPGHADLVHADAERGGARIVDAEILQRLAHVEIGLAGRHDADARPGAVSVVDHGAVEAVCARERGDRCHLRPVQAPLGLQRRIGPLRMPSPTGGSWKSVGITIWMRSGSTHTEAPLSTVSEIALKPTQQPE